MSFDNPALVEAIKDFQAFLQAQKGAYADACAGYRSNHKTIERQVSRVMKTTDRRIDSGGVPSVIHTTVEDPTNPDVIVNSIRLSSEFLSANAINGSNEQQLSKAIIVFIYAYWDDVTRYRLAKAQGVEKDTVKLSIAGDLRLLRHAILHDKGILGEAAHKRLEPLRPYFRPDAPVLLTHDRMHHIFKLLDRGVARFTVDTLQIPSPPGGWEEVTQTAFSGPRKG